MIRTISVIAALTMLAGCGEKPQTGVSSYKPDQKPWAGAASPYNAAGYKGGDKAAWDTQMRARIQTQNEHNRVN
ncbi:hypothetical protein [Lacisediminimonas profundi]|uniref:hypothetical protein n=1 Tax=Lacisediminimonas profundi TaxID=2603856 RepID=UPI00124AFB08|nr:hypothetical protein [Lacisediminimonas profundi]